MSIRNRKIMLFFLLSCFAVQTWLVYSDTTGYEVRLSPKASQGRELWHQYNCQSCHQIYGFGGFIGPDLTNVSKRVSKEHLASVLTVGTKQMPAHHFSKQQQLALGKFLEEMDRTGVGQPRVTSETTKNTILGMVATRIGQTKALSASEKLGLETVTTQNCLSCHSPKVKRPTALTSLYQVVGHEDIEKILINGSPARGMPRFNLSGEQNLGIISFLEWLGENETVVVSELGKKNDTEHDPLPWFEYSP